jgi:hypothetical protein
MKFCIKTIVVSFLFATVFVGVTRAQDIKLKVGSKMIYAVNFQGKKYDFTVTIKSMKPNMVFDYKMSAPVSKNRTVTILQGAMDSAIELYNYFSGGPLTLKTKTSVFLSRKNFTKILEGGRTNIKIGPGKDTGSFHSDSMDTQEYKINGKMIRISAFWISDNDGQPAERYKAIGILRNKDFPLIMNMDLGWTISLREMKNVDYIELRH